MTQLTFGQQFGGDAAEEEKTASELKRKDSWYKGKTLSHSSVSTYQECPQKWKFRYIDRVPEKPRPYFSFGKSVHAGLEFLFEKLQAVPPTLDELLNHYKEQWLSEGYETPAQERWFFQEGQRILHGFYAKHKSDGGNVVKVELKFNMDIEGVPVTGFIDRIDKAPGDRVAIVDYKTGKAFDKSRVRRDPQLTLYQIAAREIMGKEVDTVSLYHLNSLTPVTVPAHTRAQEAEVRAAFVQTGHGIMNERFEPNPDYNGYCRWCDYAQICPAFSGGKKPRSFQDASLAMTNEIVDRYGKLEDRIGQLLQEKEELSGTIKSYLEKTKVEEVRGDHYSVSLVKENGSDGELKSALIEKEEQ